MLLYVVVLCSFRTVSSSILLYEYTILFIHSPAYGYMPGFQFGIFMNNAAMDIYLQVLKSTYIFISLG